MSGGGCGGGGGGDGGGGGYGGGYDAGGGYDGGSSHHHQHSCDEGNTQNTNQDDTILNYVLLRNAYNLNASSNSGSIRAAEERGRRKEIERQQSLKAAEAKREKEVKKLTEFNEHMANGTQHLKDKQYGLGINSFNAALRLFPDNPTAKFNTAMCYKNCGDFKAEYEILMDLNKRSKTVEIGNALLTCEAELTKIGNQSFEKAKKAYEAGTSAEALDILADIKVKIPNIYRSDLGSKVSDLEKQITWNNSRTELINQFNDAKALLVGQAYKAALDRFTNCSISFNVNDKWLLPEDRKASEELPALIDLANLGITKLKDTELQTKINTELDSLRQLVTGFKYAEAITACNAIIALNEQIKDSKNVEALGFIANDVLLRTLQTLQALNSFFRKRCDEFSNDMERSIFAQFKTITIEPSDLLVIFKQVEIALQQQWHNLDQRNLNTLKNLIINLIPKHIKKYFLATGCMGPTHYLKNENAFATALAEVIRTNIPPDIRKPIELDIFKSNNNANETAPTALLFSEGTTGAIQPVPPTPPVAVIINDGKSNRSISLTAGT